MNMSSQPRMILPKGVSEPSMTSIMPKSMSVTEPCVSRVVPTNCSMVPAFHMKPAQKRGSNYIDKSENGTKEVEVVKWAHDPCRISDSLLRRYPGIG